MSVLYEGETWQQMSLRASLFELCKKSNPGTLVTISREGASGTEYKEVPIGKLTDVD